MSGFNILQGITLFQAVAASTANTFHKEPRLLMKNINIIKSQLCRPSDNDEVNQKNDNKIKILGGCELFLKFCKVFPCFRP